MGRPPSQPREPAARARSPEADVARVPGSRSAPRPARCPSSRLACWRSALLSDLLLLDAGDGGGRPGITGARAAGGRARGRRECARAARGSAGGRGAEARAGSLPPPIPEKGACPRHAPARGRKRRFVALGITPVSSRPWAGRGRSQVVEPSLVRLRPLSDLCGRVREMGARVGVSEPFRLRPSALVPMSSVLGPQRAGSAASRPAGSGGSWAPADARPRGRARGGPGKARRAAGLEQPPVESSPPWPARPVRPRLRNESWGPSPPPGDASSSGRGGGRRAAVAVAQGGALSRSAERGRPRRRPPARPFRLFRGPGARPILGSPGSPRPLAGAAGPSAPASGRERCDLCLSTLAWPPDLRALCTGVRSMFVYMCATRAGVCPAGRLAACVGRHANCHVCVCVARSGSV